MPVWVLAARGSATVCTLVWPPRTSQCLDRDTTQQSDWVSTHHHHHHNLYTFYILTRPQLPCYRHFLAVYNFYKTQLVQLECTSLRLLRYLIVLVREGESAISYFPNFDDWFVAQRETASKGEKLEQRECNDIAILLTHYQRIICVLCNYWTLKETESFGCTRKII